MTVREEGTRAPRPAARGRRTAAGWESPLTRRSVTASTLLHAGLLVLLAPLDGARAIGAAPERRSVHVVAQRPRFTTPTFFVEPEPDEPELVIEERVEEPLDPEETIEETVVEPRPLEEPELVPILAPGAYELLDDPAMARLRIEREPAVPPTEPAVPAPPPAESADLAGEAVPVLLEAPPPDYPRLARRRGLEGDVLCRITVGGEGRVLAAVVERTSGHPVLDEAALEAVRRWRFRPGLRAGEPTPWEVLHRVVFVLHG